MPFFTLKKEGSFYQDWLGTRTGGKVEEKGCFLQDGVAKDQVTDVHSAESAIQVRKHRVCSVLRCQFISY